MFERGLVLFLYTETSTHVGAGESKLVDLAIQRNPTLGWPMVQGSGLKGSLRGVAPGGNDSAAQWRHLAFGTDREDKRSGENFTPSQSNEHGGAISVGDAAVLAFPVASLAGVFGWITCRQAIRDFQRTYQFLPPTGKTTVAPATQGAAFDWNWDPPRIEKDNEALWLDGSALQLNGNQGPIVLQDLALNLATSGNGQELDNPRSQLSSFAKALAVAALPPEPQSVRRKLESDLVLVSDSIFTGLVDAGIHVVTRVKLNDLTGTVSQGPWDEELLPSETILYAPIMTGPGRAKVDAYNQLGQRADLAPNGKPDLTADGMLEYVTKSVFGGSGCHFQLGGDATVGCGWVYGAPHSVSQPVPAGDGSNSRREEDQA